MDRTRNADERLRAKLAQIPWLFLANASVCAGWYVLWLVMPDHWMPPIFVAVTAVNGVAILALWMFITVVARRRRLWSPANQPTPEE